MSEPGDPGSRSGSGGRSASSGSQSLSGQYLAVNNSVHLSAAVGGVVSRSLVRGSSGAGGLLRASSGAAPVSYSAPASPQPPRKKLRLDDRLTSSEEVTLKRQNVLDYKLDRLDQLRRQYDQLCSELYFLEDSPAASLMDLPAWQRRPSLQYLNHRRRLRLDSDEDEPPVTTTTTTTTPVKREPRPGGAEVKVPSAGGTPVALSNTLPASVSKLASHKGGVSTVRSPHRISGPAAHRDPHSSAPEHMVEKAKQEAHVMQRVSALRKQGLWTEKRLPKVAEPKRIKCHWDYLLEEVQWLATDFAQERKWKKAAARKCARMVQKYHQDRAAQAERAVKDQERDLRRIASFVAREVRTFWSNVEKLVEFKFTSRLEEKRKKALDQHLNFIVNQTEKYSEKLVEALKADSGAPSGASSAAGLPSRQHSDDEFEPGSGSEDDEETIERAERSMRQHDTSAEVNALQRESALSLEDVLDQLPPGYLENRDKALTADDKASSLDSDDDFEAASDAGSDDEATIAEQEGNEQNQDHSKEISQLEKESQMPLDELMRRYDVGGTGGGSASTNGQQSAADDAESDAESDDMASLDDDDVDDGGEADEEDSEEEGEEEGEEETEMEIGLKSLLDMNASDAGDAAKASDASRLSGPAEITDVAAMAETFQPKGYTLSSTTVRTPVPFLLKHSLREYQHVGLEWLVTMCEKRLNGILADEMGLGKTIQTIALLAHLACEKANWGPHLIVVPTSVMLNWEMELKKWCPAFKILTYYGSQKERRLKRTGWTKQNNFHVCITSYKLVLQDHAAFRRKKWKYLILDEAQNIKNFKSQRWQLLLNFQSQRRLLLTGTPLQNNLMELWSLMHFLMPHVFASHREFKEWFSNPVSGMIEGNTEYNDSIIKRLHKVLRPFLLRRLKSEVEKQLPKKYEHVIMCRLSKRQRYLYDEFMGRTKTKETLAQGNFMSVINILMQLRKVCNHPDMFEPRPVVSPFRTERLEYHTASCVWGALQYDPLRHVDLASLNLLLADLELTLTAFAAHRTRRFQAPRRLIEEIDQRPPPPPRCPAGRIKLHVRATPPQTAGPAPAPAASVPRPLTPASTAAAAAVGAAGGVVTVAGGGGGAVTPLRGYALQVVQGGVVKTIPLSALGGAGGPVALQIQQGLQGARLAPATGASPGSNLVLQAGKPILGQLQPRPLGNGTRPGTPATVDAQSLAALLAARGLPANTSVTFARLAPASPATGQPPVRPPASNALVNSVPSQPAVNAASPQPAPALASRPAVVPRFQQPSPLLSPRPTPPPSPSPSPGGRLSPPPQPARPHSIFRISSLEEQRRMMRKEKLSTLYRLNRRRCEACPVYGSDLVQSVSVLSGISGAGGRVPSWNGLLDCTPPVSELAAARSHWRHTGALHHLLPTPQLLLHRLSSVLSRFVFYTPSVAAPTIRLHVSHPAPSRLQAERLRRLRLLAQLSPPASLLHPIASAMTTQFPERRLIQYDCGKLQVMDRLLHQLKSGGHRVLIFTQMTRMLDILEQFLNFHGHIYLRLDGTTRVDQRQALMERFNADRRIFCFILSTRSGGIGVNLTGADTVIFYDSDWNPTMDAQAQDRCHRIGQTRDVHIYRLVSEKTIEENILKKANQKRLLGDLAIEGGNFTTAFFKQSALQDLFQVDMAEDDAIKRMADVVKMKEKSEPRTPAVAAAAPVTPAAPAEVTPAAAAPAPDRGTEAAFETALAAAEDEWDARAACTARAEADAEMAEFDENIPLEQEPELEEVSRAELELRQLVSQLAPIERWAMSFVELTDDALQREADRAAAEIDAQKREWEADQRRALRQHQLQRQDSSDDEALSLTYPADQTSQVWISEAGGNQMMPVWAPPTPPRDNSDVYMDQVSSCLLYEPLPMTEAQLPPVFVKKEPRRIKTEPVTPATTGSQVGTVAAGVASTSAIGTGTSGLGPGAAGSPGLVKKPVKVKREEGGFAPRSLFNRLSPAVMKMRRDLRLQQRRTLFSPGGSLGLPAVKPPLLPSKAGQLDEHAPEWIVHEDWALLQAIKSVLEMPLNLVVVSPAHTPNWDLVAELVNQVSRAYRSPKQCRLRFETVVQPREEGKLIYEPGPKKKKHKLGPGKLGLAAMKTGRPLRTSQLILQDKNQAFSQLYISRFENMKSIANKRAPTTRPSLLAPASSRNPKHAAVLTESGIEYDQPLTPVEVAANRASRIAKEKQKSATVEQLSRLQQKAAGAAAAAVPVSAARPQVVPARVSAVVTSAGAGAVVSVAGLTPAQVQAAQRLVSGVAAARPAPTAGSLPLQTLTQKALTPSQLQALKQQTVLRHKLALDKRYQAAGTAAGGAGPSGAASAAPAPASGAQPAAGGSQRLQVAVSSLGGVAAVPVSQAQARTQVRILKQAAGKQMVAARTMTESEMAAILKQKPQLSQVQSALVPQFLAQVQSAAARAGQVQAGPSTSGATQTVTIPVTAISMAGVSLPQMRSGTPTKVTTSGQQPIRQLALQKQLVAQPQRKLAAGAQSAAQLAGKRVPAQLSAVQIVQGGGQKQLPSTVTVQQLQQVVRVQPPSSLAGVRSSPSQQLQARLIPAGTHPSGIRQTIQVVSAPAAPGGAPLATVVSRPGALQQVRPTAAAVTAVQLIQPGTAVTAVISQQQQTTAVALAQLRPLSSSAVGSPVTQRGSPYTMRLRTAPIGTATVPVTAVTGETPPPPAGPSDPPPPPPDSAT